VRLVHILDFPSTLADLQAVSKRNYLFDVFGWLGFTLDAGLMGNDARYINTVYGPEAVKRRKINTDAACEFPSSESSSMPR
jgi:hypothetical protein